MFLRLFLNYVEIKTKKNTTYYFFIWIQSLLQQSSQSTMIYICQKFKDEQEIQELCKWTKDFGDALNGDFWQGKLEVVKLKEGNLMQLFA